MKMNNLITYTLEKMHARLVQDSFSEDEPVRNGLLFTGNVHDAIPRRLMMDTRLSPLDKTAWVMIRLHAQNNEGAVFPSYDELQQLLASPYKGRASRETVSRVLQMLRITGWLSLCKRVRDDKGRVRGNIYALHDEPLTLRDAEFFDQQFLKMVENSCMSKNHTISQTAWNVLSEIKADPMMRHYHSHICMLEARMGSPQVVVQTLDSDSELSKNQPDSDSELSKNQPDSDSELSKNQPDSDSELSKNQPDSDSEPSVKSMSYNRVRFPNYYVRNLRNIVKKNTYVLPVEMKVSSEDRISLTDQLQALPEDQAGQILWQLKNMLAKRQLKNPTAWTLAMMEKARKGNLNLVKNQAKSETEPLSRQPAQQPAMPDSLPVRQPVSEEQVKHFASEIRAQLKSAAAQAIKKRAVLPVATVAENHATAMTAAQEVKNHAVLPVATVAENHATAMTAAQEVKNHAVLPVATVAEKYTKAMAAAQEVKNHAVLPVATVAENHATAMTEAQEVKNHAVLPVATVAEKYTTAMTFARVIKKHTVLPVATVAEKYTKAMAAAQAIKNHAVLPVATVA